MIGINGKVCNRVSLEKIMKLDTDNSEKAIEMAQDDFPYLEQTAEWLNEREVTFKENTFISRSAEKLAELYHKNFNMKDFKELLDIAFGSTEIRNFIYDETLCILENKYGVLVKSKDV